MENVLLETVIDGQRFELAEQTEREKCQNT
jgi:hypothetical protein